MALSSDLRNVTIIESNDTVRLEKIRWSIRQRLRKQMLQLSHDFFDEVDDFLFSGGQQGQFAEDSVYLKSMREFRAKQGLFEETFVDAAIKQIKSSYLSSVPKEYQQSSTSCNAMEKVEIDIALKAIARKALKNFSPLIKQIDSLKGNNGDRANKLFAGATLLDAVVSAFSESHGTFKVSLDVRLVFIKLFEKHFVLNSEKLFLDIISIVNNANDHNFVEKLYSSSSAFRAQITQVKQSQDRLHNHRKSVVEKGAQKSEIVESAVSQLISALCLQKDLPDFVEAMIRTNWRAVMLLIGLNKGTGSNEWAEAKHAVSTLTSVISSNLAVNDRDQADIFERLRQGFSMVQMASVEQEKFITKLQNKFGSLTDSFETCILVPENSQSEERDESPEASISPTGEQIINQDDLDEIAKLLGSNSTDDESQNDEKNLVELQTNIDELGASTNVEYLVNGSFEGCTLQRSKKSGFYTISNSSGFSLNRSRLGLAIAIQSGDLKIPGYRLALNAQNNTLLPTSITRH